MSASSVRTKNMTELIQTLSDDQRSVMIRPIKSEADYDAYLAEIGLLLRDGPPAEDSPEADRLDVISTLVEAWEQKHHAIPPLDPVQAIEARLDELGLDRSFLEPILGSRGRVADLLNRRRALSKANIRRLAEALSLPVAVLIQPYETIPPGSAGP